MWETSVWSPPPIYVNFLISKTSCFSFLAVSMLQLLRLWPLVAASTMLCLITAPSSSPEILNTPTNQSSNIFMSNQECNMLKQTSVVAKRALHAATSENTWKWVNWEKTYALQVERITKYTKEFRGKTFGSGVPRNISICLVVLSTWWKSLSWSVLCSFSHRAFNFGWV